MNDRYRQILEKYRTLSEELAAGAIAGDSPRYAGAMKEYADLAPVAEAIRTLQKLERDLAEAHALLEDPAEELRALARDEIYNIEKQQEETEQKLRLLLLPKDKNSDKNVIVEIRGGTGGEEGALFAATLQRMYTRYCERKHWQTETLFLNETERGGIKEIGFLVRGRGAWDALRFESGVHRVQRVPETESQGRIHTSAATVAVLPEAEEVDVALDPADLQIDTFRAGGAGGQHVNKTESAIRITHLPTGIVAECQDERSQYKNKDKALRILRARLLQAEQEKQAQKIAGERKAQVGSGDRSQRIRTYNYPQGRVTDHRINLTLYRLTAVLDGELDELIDALREADTAKKLAEGE